MRNSNKDNVKDTATQEVHDYVSRVKILPEVQVEFMKFEEIIYYERKEAAFNMRIQNIQELLEEYGEIPAQINERLCREEKEEVLKRWLKLAAKVSSIEEFVQKMDDV